LAGAIPDTSSGAGLIPKRDLVASRLEFRPQARIEGGKLVEGWNYHNLLEFALERGKAGESGGSS
jgi:hypothetical protein